MPRHLPLQAVAAQPGGAQAFAHHQFGLGVRALVALHAFVHRPARRRWRLHAHRGVLDARAGGCALLRVLVGPGRDGHAGGVVGCYAAHFAVGAFGCGVGIFVRVVAFVCKFACNRGLDFRFRVGGLDLCFRAFHLHFRRDEAAFDAALGKRFAQRAVGGCGQKRRKLGVPAFGQPVEAPLRVRGACRGKHVRRQPHLPLQVALVQAPGCAAVAHHGADVRRFQHALDLRRNHVFDAGVA